MPRSLLLVLAVATVVGLAPAQVNPAPAGDSAEKAPVAKEAEKPVKHAGGEANGNGNGAHVVKPAAPGEAPKIHCTQPQFDFGEAGQYEDIVHDYEIENVGKGDLIIIDAKGGCGCTAVAPDKKTLKPGEKGKVKVTLSTQANQGAMQKTVTVTTNDPTTPNYVLTISGRVAQPFRPTVTELNFGSVKKGQEVPPKTFDILTNSSQSIVDIKTDKPEVKASYELLPLSEKQQGYRITVKLEGDLGVGQIRSTISITTTVPAQKTIAIPVLAIVEGEIDVTPRTFSWAKVKVAEAPTKVVELKKSGKADLKIENVTVKPEGAFTAKVEEAEAGKHYRIVLSVAPDAKPGFSRGTMTIKTNCPGEDELSVYFYALLQP